MSGVSQSFARQRNSDKSLTCYQFVRGVTKGLTKRKFLVFLKKAKLGFVRDRLFVDNLLL